MGQFCNFLEDNPGGSVQNQVHQPLQQFVSPEFPGENICPIKTTEWFLFSELDHDIFPQTPSNCSFRGKLLE